jgi:nucleoid-associated protein Lsr2
MAKTTIVQVSDDLDGSTNASEVRFAFEGTEYTIDLSNKNRKAFEKALRPYIEAGTKVSGRRSGSSRSAPPKRSEGSSVDLAAVRAWAKENGHQVSDRGRLPKAVLDAYNAAR